jgi:hypothetical protein
MEIKIAYKTCDYDVRLDYKPPFLSAFTVNESKMEAGCNNNNPFQYAVAMSEMSAADKEAGYRKDYIS